MNIQLRSATSADQPLLLPLMQRYYEDDGLSFSAANAAAMSRLLSARDYGRVWLIEVDARLAGYVVLCFGYSLELGGRDAYIDEMFVERNLRGRGIAKAALTAVIQEARSLDVRAIHLEVDTQNDSGVRLYAALDFRARDRYCLMTRTL
ncbi:MAG: GNAT family N-acetyltransferase [Steroidobacteraceae bacterium]